MKAVALILALCALAGSPCAAQTITTCNSDMMIDQRHAGDINHDGAGAYTPGKALEHTLVDCQRFLNLNSGGGEFEVLRSTTDVPPGFGASLQMRVTTRGKPLNDANVHWEQFWEPDQVAALKMGTPDAEPFTWSATVKCDVTGPFSVGFTNGTNSRWFVGHFEYPEPGRWRRVSVTAPGDPAPEWGFGPASTSSIRLKMVFDLGMGDLYAVPEPSAGWSGGPLKLRVNGTTRLIEQPAGSACKAVGTQMDIGTSPRPYRYTPLPESLRMAQRYICTSFPPNVPPKQGSAAAGAALYTVRTAGEGATFEVPIVCPVEMFMTPIATFYGVTNSPSGHFSNITKNRDSGAPDIAFPAPYGDSLGPRGGVVRNRQLETDAAGDVIGIHWVLQACPGIAGIDTGC